MKKLIATTLLIFSLSITAAFAATEKTDIHAPLLIAADSTTTEKTFIPSTIPRPDTLPGPTASEQENEGTRNILVDTILPKFAIGLVGFVGGVALLMIIIGGARFTMAYGNDEAAEKAKKQVTYGIVGFVIALLAYAAVMAIINIRFEGDQSQVGADILTNSEVAEATEMIKSELGEEMESYGDLDEDAVDALLEDYASVRGKTITSEQKAKIINDIFQ